MAASDITRLDFHGQLAKRPADVFAPPLLTATSLPVRRPRHRRVIGRAAGRRASAASCRSTARARSRSTGIHVDVGGKDAATRALCRLAPRPARRAARCSGRSTHEPPARPKRRTCPIRSLDGIVSSIIVEQEQIGPNRYIAGLGMLFDRARTGQLLGVAGEVRRSAPMLLIPVLTTGGTATSFEFATPGSAPGPSSAPRKARSIMSGSAAWGSIRCWSTPPRPSGPAAAGGGCCSTNMAPPTSWSPRSSCSASIRAARLCALHRPLRPRREILGGFELDSAKTAPTSRA